GAGFFPNFALGVVGRGGERKKHPEEFTKMTMEESQKERSVLNYLGADSDFDKFTPQINAAIAEFENKLRPHIQR
ncbi:MAG: hypothetical protein AABZ25_02265, partial [Nitrospirota bacterium]